MAEVSAENMLDILAYWHRIEFFIPYDLDRVTQQTEKTKKIPVAGLGGRAVEDLWHIAVADGKEVTRLSLYLGVFAKKEIDDLGKRLCVEPAGPGETDEDAERGDLKGDSCFAKLTLTTQGTPDFRSISVSTAPWAIGRCAGGDLKGLMDQNRADAFDALKDRLHNFEMERRAAAPASTELPLTGTELLSLLDLLQDWAGFSPR